MTVDELIIELLKLPPEQRKLRAWARVECEADTAARWAPVTSVVPLAGVVGRKPEEFVLIDCEPLP